MQRKNDIKMEQIAYVDEITGGKSFEKFKLEADKLIKETDNNYVLVDLDIDKFKYINDIFGYEEGNVVIRFIWKLIDDMIEEEETFAHHRADQFVLLLKLDDMDRVIERIEKLADDANKKKNIYEKNYEIDLSIGIYPIDKRYYQIDTAIGRARLTKKSIKGQHSKIYAIYDEELRQKVLQDQE
jgi:diguanylate cyclase (GGDEF)-like protein